MPVIISSNLTLTAPEESDLTLDHPVIGWQSLCTSSNVFADSADSNYPVSNIANPATHLFWKTASTSDQVITLTTGTTDPIDYLAIAAHNFGSLGTPVSVGYYDTSSPPVWTELVAESMLANDSPVLFRFSAQILTRISLRFNPNGNFPQIAVMYVGKLLVLPRKLYQGFAPINYARVAKVTNGRSEAGNFLGRIVLQEFVKDTVPLSLIDPTYFRDHIAEFLVDSKERPFFIAWRPQTYPLEVGYCHMTNDPLPINEAPHGLIAMQLEMTGVI